MKRDGKGEDRKGVVDSLSPSVLLTQSCCT